MLESVLGKDLFYKGLQHYLSKHKYSNADYGDLILAFEHVSGIQDFCANFDFSGS